MSRSNHGDRTSHHPSALSIRLARQDDLAQLTQIEVSAGAQFREVGMSEIADDGPPGQEFFTEVLTAGTLWVADVGPRLAAYGAATVLDGHGHLEQVSVHSDFARRGIGLRLLTHMTQWARDTGYPRATLITFAEVPWNAPYYRKIGFQPIDTDAMGPELTAAFAAEKLTDLRHWKRICMEKRF